MGTIIEIVKPCEEAKSLTQWDLGRKIIIRPDAETIVDEVRFSNVLSKKALVVEPTFDELGNIVSGIPNILLQSSLEIYVSVAMHFKDGKCVIHKETLEVAPEKKPSDYIYTEIEIKNYEELEQRIKALEEQGTGGNGKPGSDGFSPIANVVETTEGALITITDKNGTTTATVKNGKDGKDGADGAKGEKGDKGDTGTKGTDGTSVAIKNISESTADGGNNVVTFSDGQKIIIKNGTKGSKGDDGYTPQKNVDYFDGKDGRNGIDGKDGYTPIKGKDYFDGQNGKDGADGKTPQKGTDYFTEADKAEIVTNVLNALPTWKGGAY